MDIGLETRKLDFVAARVALEEVEALP